MNTQERMAKALEVLGKVGVAPQTRCSTGKGMHPTRRDAEIMCRKLAKRKSLHGERLDCYHCKECGNWHLSRQH